MLAHPAQALGGHLGRTHLGCNAVCCLLRDGQAGCTVSAAASLAAIVAALLLLDISACKALTRHGLVIM